MSTYAHRSGSPPSSIAPANQREKAATQTASFEKATREIEASKRADALGFVSPEYERVREQFIQQWLMANTPQSQADKAVSVPVMDQQAVHDDCERAQQAQRQERGGAPAIFCP